MLQFPSYITLVCRWLGEETKVTSADTNLCLWVNETDSMLVNGDQQDLGNVGLCGLLNTNETILYVTANIVSFVSCLYTIM